MSSNRTDILWYMQVEYYTSRKMNEPLLCATKWINLTNILLSEENQTQRIYAA